MPTHQSDSYPQVLSALYRKEEEVKQELDRDIRKVAKLVKKRERESEIRHYEVGLQKLVEFDSDLIDDEEAVSKDLEELESRRQSLEQEEEEAEKERLAKAEADLLKFDGDLVDPQLRPELEQSAEFLERRKRKREEEERQNKQEKILHDLYVYDRDLLDAGYSDSESDMEHHEDGKEQAEFEEHDVCCLPIYTQHNERNELVRPPGSPYMKVKATYKTPLLIAGTKVRSPSPKAPSDSTSSLSSTSPSSTARTLDLPVAQPEAKPVKKSSKGTPKKAESPVTPARSEKPPVKKRRSARKLH